MTPISNVENILPAIPYVSPLGFSDGCGFAILLIVLVAYIAFLNMIVSSLFMKMRKKDMLVVFTTNMISKILLLASLNIAYINENYLILIIGLFLMLIMETIIYKSLLTNKKINSLLLSLLSDIGTALLLLLLVVASDFSKIKIYADLPSMMCWAISFTLASVVLALIVGLGKRDCVALGFTSFVLKLAMAAIYGQDKIRPLAHEDIDINSFWMLVLLFIGVTIIEGIIYKYFIDNKENKGFKLAVKCNGGTIGLIIFLKILLMFLKSFSFISL